MDLCKGLSIVLLSRLVSRGIRVTKRVTILDSNDLQRIQSLVNKVRDHAWDLEDFVSEIEEILENSQNVEGPN